MEFFFLMRDFMGLVLVIMMQLFTQLESSFFWFCYHTNFEAFSFCPIGNHLKDLLEKIGDMILNPEWPFSLGNKRR